MSEYIVVKNVCGANIKIKEADLPPEGVKRIPYNALLRADVRESWRRGFINILAWPSGKEPISYGNDSAPQFQLPDGLFKRDEA